MKKLVWECSSTTIKFSVREKSILKKKFSHLHQGELELNRRYWFLLPQLGCFEEAADFFQVNVLQLAYRAG